MLNLTVQVSVNPAEYPQPSKKSKHGKHKQDYYAQYYAKNKQKFLLSQKKYRLKLKVNKSPKPLSEFQQNKQKHLLKLLVNHRSFVPVPQKLKHPIIKSWNSSDYWYKPKIDFNNLERGCVRIYEDNWNNCFIGWLDIDCKKWTKIAKKYSCGYVKSPKGHIRIPFLFKSKKSQEKTGTLYYQNQKIGDAKISGEVMLPGNAYYDKKGKFLGYYEWKHWGTFFPKQNHIFQNPNEFWELLKQDFGIEYKSISQHFYYQKNLTETDYTPQELYNIPVKEPPWQKLIITPRNSFSK